MVDLFPKNGVIFPITGYSNSLEYVPKLNLEYIKNLYNSKSSSSRHLERSENFLKEQYVDPASVQVCYKSTSSTCYIKAKCYKSKKKSHEPYNVVLAIAVPNGLVLDSNCDCPIGAGQFCNHYMALLKLISLLREKHFKEIPKELACTELPQVWNRPRGPAIGNFQVTDINFESTTRNCPKSMTSKLFDPRNSPRDEMAYAEDVSKLATALKKNGNEVFGNILEKTRFSKEPWVETQLGPFSIESTLHHQMAFIESGFAVIHNLAASHRDYQVVKPDGGMVYPNINRHQDFQASGCYFPLPMDQDVVFEANLVSVNEALEIERNSRAQFESSTWNENKKTRLTASKFGRVLVRRADWSDSAVENVMKPKKIDTIPAVRYGVKSEPIAAKKY